MRHTSFDFGVARAARDAEGAPVKFARDVREAHSGPLHGDECEIHEIRRLARNVSGVCRGAQFHSFLRKFAAQQCWIGDQASRIGTRRGVTDLRGDAIDKSGKPTTIPPACPRA